MQEKEDSSISTMSAYDPDPAAYVQYQRTIYGSLHAPKYSTKPSEWEAAARRTLPAPNYFYIAGAASSQRTHAANLAAFNRYRLRPCMLVQATQRSLAVELFGKTYPTPLLLAPIGVQGIVHEDGEEATARAARAAGVCMVLSTAATRSIEEVAAANGEGTRWYQLYWPKRQADELTASLLHRAQENGYEVLVVTLDTFQIGWRPEDLDTGYLPFVWGTGCQVGFSDPVFQRLWSEEQERDQRSVGEKVRELWQVVRRPGSLYGAARVLANVGVMGKAMFFMSLIASGHYREWDDLKMLRELWKGPIVLKGIQSVQDAHLAIQHGMDGIIVSNHGGRQLDGAIASLDALAEIGADEKVKTSNLTLLFDSGIRTGSDVLKALALGAKAVLVGRPYVYGLAMGGEEGVKHVLDCLLADVDSSLANVGRRGVGELGREDLQVEVAKL